MAGMPIGGIGGNTYAAAVVGALRREENLDCIWVLRSGIGISGGLK